MPYDNDTLTEKTGSTVLHIEEIAERIAASYREVAPKYRRDDEIEITTGHHKHLKDILSKTTSGFGHPISVLDLGCGTGRYFYCLQNVEHLTGMDICGEMLRIAENPVKQDEITIKSIQLQFGNAHLVSFPSQAFDFIYSLGMFGNGCPVTVEICNRFYDWLKPGGKLFFDTVDVATLPLIRRIRKSIRKGVYPFLPKTLKASLDQREGKVPFCGLSKKELIQIMRASRFKTFSVSSQECQSPLWEGYHLECSASKPS